MDQLLKPHRIFKAQLTDAEQLAKVEKVSDYVFRIEMPEGSKILHAEFQLGIPTLWFFVDPDAPKHWRQFRIIGTGDQLEPGIAAEDCVGMLQSVAAEASGPKPVVSFIFELKPEKPIGGKVN